MKAKIILTSILCTALHTVSAQEKQETPLVAKDSVAVMASAQTALLTQTQLEEKAKKYKAISNYKNNLKFTSLPYENEMVKNDNLLKEKRDRWHESLSKDVYVEEALNVLDDFQPNASIKGTVNVKKKDKLVKS